MAKKKQQHDFKIKDDGSRYKIIDRETGRPVYAGEGQSQHEAERLAKSLVRDCYIVQVKGA